MGPSFGERTNWSTYNKALINRGYAALLVEFEGEWKVIVSGERTAREVTGSCGDTVG